jgi:hypothetical protein
MCVADAKLLDGSRPAVNSMDVRRPGAGRMGWTSSAVGRTGDEAAPDARTEKMEGAAAQVDTLEA